MLLVLRERVSGKCKITLVPSLYCLNLTYYGSGHFVHPLASERPSLLERSTDVFPVSTNPQRCCVSIFTAELNAPFVVLRHGGDLSLCVVPSDAKPTPWQLLPTARPYPVGWSLFQNGGVLETGAFARRICWVLHADLT